jgi:hypothetical protein
MAMASYGRTEGIGTPDSLLAQVSSVRTVAFSVGVATRQLCSTATTGFAVTFSVPAKVRTGTLQYSGLALQAGDPGTPAYGAPTLNLRPTATERDLEFGYTTHDWQGRPPRQADRRRHVARQSRPRRQRAAGPG